MGDFVGILNINKPSGWTSHDVVARARRLASQKRVGHAGTLDPLAHGVLPVLVGRATRLADFIQSGRKTYLGTVRLGSSTETDDAEGAVTSCASVPALDASRIEDALANFRGEILQTPPKYSALKVAGRKAYDIARGGGEVELVPRRITIDDLRLLRWTPAELDIEVTCSKGTYIRALARDIAVALGTVGHLAELARTRVGPFLLENALTLDEIAERGVQTSLLPASCAIPEAPSFHADAQQSTMLRQGRPIAVEFLRSQAVWVYDPDGQIVCLASMNQRLLAPRIVL